MDDEPILDFSYYVSKPKAITKGVIISEEEYQELLTLRKEKELLAEHNERLTIKLNYYYDFYMRYELDKHKVMMEQGKDNDGLE